jgi:TonB family protein
MEDVFYNSDDPRLARFLFLSICFHLALVASIALSIWLQRPGNAWGGIGGPDSGSVKVNLVSNATIPMPSNPNPTDSDVVDPTKGLNKEEEIKPKIPEPKTPEEKIPEFEKNKPLPPSKLSKTFEKKVPPPQNAVPYGKGGQMNVPSGYSQEVGPPSGGTQMIGQGGGDFATRYAWYVEAVKRAINQNWMQNTIDPSVRAARRAHTVVIFRINRNGTVQNIRLDTSSGNRSMDDSAQRALLSIDKFPPLPADYSGTYVDVTFDFDLSLTK